MLCCEFVFNLAIFARFGSGQRCKNRRQEHENPKSGLFASMRHKSITGMRGVPRLAAGAAMRDHVAGAVPASDRVCGRRAH